MFALLAAVTLAQAPAEVTVPFKLLPSRHMLMSVTLNGKGPYNLIFDTGAPLNLVNTRVGREAKLAKAKGGIGGGLGFGLLGGVKQVEIDKLAVGGVTADRLPAMVMDHPTVSAISGMFGDDYGPIEGIVGFPFFGRYAATVDYQAKTLTLRPNGYKPGDYLNDLTQGMLKAGDRGAEPRVVGSAGLWGFVAAPADDGKPGLMVEKVFAGGPAAASGLTAGDRLLTVAGRWTDTTADLAVAASLAKPGRLVLLTVRRGENVVTLPVTPVNGF